MLTNPARAFSRCRFEPEPNRKRLAFHIAVASFLMGSVAPFAAALSPNTDPFSLLVAAVALPLFAFTWVPVFFVIRLLTYIEARGIRFFGARRRFRITPNVALAICAHAAPGWTFGGVLVVAGVVLGAWLQYLATHQSTGPLHLYLLAAPVGLPVMGLFAGMIWFETMVWMGVRKCRYANTSEATSEWLAAEPRGVIPASDPVPGSNQAGESGGSPENAFGPVPGP